MNILIVDDVKIMRLVIRDMLVNHCKLDPGKIHEAQDGTQALNLFREKRHEIVFLDIHMPGQDGISILKELLKIDPKVNVIMCSASRNRESVVQSILIGAKDYIAKPPSLARIESTLRKPLLNKTLDVAEEAEIEPPTSFPHVLVGEKGAGLETAENMVQEIMMLHEENEELKKQLKAMKSK